MNDELKFQLEKLELNGTEEKKDIVVVQFQEDIGAHQHNAVKSLQAEIQTLKNESDMKNVAWIILPNHIRLTNLTDEELDSMGLCRK
jgi:hypothetical protein